MITVLSNFNMSDLQPIGLDKIAELEVSLGHTLAPEYKDFLTQYNGAQLINTVCKVDQGYTVISILFTYQHISNNLTDYYDDSNIQHLQMLPIADDIFGNLFCLSMNKKNLGKIFFYDHETGTFTKISENFENFTISLIDKKSHDKQIIAEDSEFAKRLEELRRNSKFSS